MNLTNLNNQLTALQEEYELDDSQLVSKIGVTLDDLLMLREGRTLSEAEGRKFQNFIEKLSAHIYPTKLLDKMERLLAATYKETAITVIGSPSGAGKTLAAERFSHANAFSVYVYIPEIITPRYLLTILAGKLGLPSLGLPMHVLFESICMQLGYEKRLLVLDEADRLSKKMFEILRDLWHDGKGNVGIAFVGDENLMNKLKQQHSLKDNLIRLMRRVKYHEIMDPLHVDDISMAFKHAFGKHKIDQQTIKQVYHRFNKLGGFGSILNVIDKVRKFSEKHGETPNSEMVEEAIKRIKI